MKKKLLVLLAFTLVCTSVFAFDIMQYPSSVQAGNWLVNAGVGFGRYGSSNWNVRIPPLSASAEYCLNVGPPISVGGMVTFIQYDWNADRVNSWYYSFIIIAARANWHWNFPVNNLDFYTGLSMGYQYFTSTYTGTGYNLAASYEWNYRGLYWGGQVGARYFFTQKVGAFAEFGYPTWLKAGLTIKF